MNRPKTPAPLLALQMEALRAQFPAKALGLPLPYFYATSDFLAEVICWLPDERQQEAMAALTAIAGKA
ncbi:hypothetical protein [Stenotrophomonas maltophilia]|uniref:hypothetical protein n=1 Tax=Stenotrophomonas maltophilia TaxID=40324 RepID=UPI001EF99F25|nr:hypothetical protein [Stenotrophomonas maltophilia]